MRLRRELCYLDHHHDLPTSAFRAAKVESHIRDRHPIWPAIKRDDNIMVISAGLTEGSDSVQTFQCGGPQPKERDQELGVSPGPSRERMAIHLGAAR
jgi:hypothetical protein